MNSENFFLKKDIDVIIKKISGETKKLNNTKFLITGANGFLGKYFIACLLEINKVLRKKIKIYAIDIQFDNCELFISDPIKKQLSKIPSHLQLIKSYPLIVAVDLIFASTTSNVCVLVT